MNLEKARILLDEYAEMNIKERHLKKIQHNKNVMTADFFRNEEPEGYFADFTNCPVVRQSFAQDEESWNPNNRAERLELNYPENKKFFIAFYSHCMGVSSVDDVLMLRITSFHNDFDKSQIKDAIDVLNWLYLNCDEEKEN